MNAASENEYTGTHTVVTCPKMYSEERLELALFALDCSGKNVEVRSQRGQALLAVSC